MNWLKLLRHDFRGGLLRWRYCAALLLFAIPCFQSRSLIGTGSWMDYLLGCFKGLPPQMSLDTFSFPIQWFLVMAGSLFVNLDYPLNDLTRAGQQVIIRSVSKRGWFLSKCAWNLLSCAVYILLGALTALVFALATGGSITFTSTPAFRENILEIYGTNAPTAAQTLIAAVGLPLLTLIALNMLQMVLCLLIKPVFSFLICVSLLVVSLFWASPYVPGNGAMVLRSSLLTEGGQEPVTVLLACFAVIGICIIVGMIRFNRMDHLRYE